LLNTEWLTFELSLFRTVTVVNFNDLSVQSAPERQLCDNCGVFALRQIYKLIRVLFFNLLNLIPKAVKPVFHFNRIVAKRSVFLCFLSTRVELMTSTQKKMLRYVTIRLKWKTGLKAVFSRIVPYRSVFLCFLSTRVELMTSTQKKML
jgi:hypothetical protein